MRATIVNLVDALTATVALPEPIYEFGAYRVAGQEQRRGPRECLRGRQYVGCDIRPGPGVDRVLDLHRLELSPDTIGTALILDTLEHVRAPWQAMTEVHRCLRTGGLVVIASVMFFPIHAYPDDYWRFTASGFAELLQGFDPIALDMCGLRRLPHTVVGIASKGPVDANLARAAQTTLAAWKRRGASSWRDTLLALLPPALLGPAYDAYLRRLEQSGKRARPETPEPRTGSGGD